MNPKTSINRTLRRVVSVGLLCLTLSLIGQIKVTQADSTVTEFTIPTAGSYPWSITNGPDGNLWFTEKNNHQIGRITPSGIFTEFFLPGQTSFPFVITAGPDGNLWFTETFAIGRITPSGTVTEFPIATPISQASGITSGPDGNLWFTEKVGNKIGRITPTGVITEFRVPSRNSMPSYITSAPDGNLWFTESHSSKIGRITPNGLIAEFPVPTANSRPMAIIAGPDGNIWFVEADGTGIGQVTPRGKITEYQQSPFDDGLTDLDPNGITTGPDGNLWFTELPGSRIGSISPNGAFKPPISLPQSYSIPSAITVGPDGNLWFTELYKNIIGRVNLNLGTNGPSIVTPQLTLTPLSTTACSAPPTQLAVGMDGHVASTTAGQAPILVRVRSQPNISGTVILELSAGTYFHVINGPACANKLIWWNIQLSNGITGWVAEGDKSGHFIEPAELPTATKGL